MFHDGWTIFLLSLYSRNSKTLTEKTHQLTGPAACSSWVSWAAESHLSPWLTSQPPDQLQDTMRGCLYPWLSPHPPVQLQCNLDQKKKTPKTSPPPLRCCLSPPITPGFLSQTNKDVSSEEALSQCDTAPPKPVWPDLNGNTLDSSQWNRGESLVLNTISYCSIH